MPSGFSAGFSRGLAGVMKTSREQTLRKQSEEADRALRANLAILGPAIQQGIESDDYTLAERILIEINPDFGKQWKKEGSPFATLGPMLKEQYDLEQGAARGSAAIESAPEGGAGPGAAATTGPAAGAAAPGAAIVATEDADQTSTVNRILEMFGIPPMGDGVSGPTASPGGPFGTPPFVPQDAPATGRSAGEPSTPAGDIEGPTIHGMPFGISSEERRERARKLGISEAMVGDQAKIRLARRLHAEGVYASLPEALAAFGIGETTTGAAADGFTLGTGQRRYDAKGNLIAEGREGAPGTASAFTLSPEQVRYDAEGNVIATGPTKTTEAEGADPGLLARARMAARQPQVLQQLTPSGVEDILGVLGQDPELYLQYEGKRQEAARAMATKLERSLDALLDTSGATPQLSPGARMIYGLTRSELGEQAARFFTAAGKEATASIKQLVGQEVLDQIAAMKAQSPTGATGFGQMNMAELDLLIASATVLQNWGLTTSNIGEERALTELVAIQGQLARILEDSDVEIEQQQLLDERERGATSVTIDLDTPLYLGLDGRYTNTPPGAP